MKHGLLSRKLSQNISDKSEYLELLHSFRSELEPQGALENALVEKITFSFWKLSSIAALISRTLTIPRSVEMMDRPLEAFALAIARHSGHDIDHIEACLKVIQSAKDQFIKTEKITSATMQDISTLIGSGLTTDLQLYLNLVYRQKILGATDPEKGKDLVRPPDPKEVIIAGLEAQEKGFGDLFSEKSRLPTIDSSKEIVFNDTKSLMFLDLLNRYETACEKQFYRALTELESWREKRRGGKGVPRLTVD